MSLQMKNSDEKLRIGGLQRQEVEGSDANADTTGLQVKHISYIKTAV